MGRRRRNDDVGRDETSSRLLASVVPRVRTTATGVVFRIRLRPTVGVPTLEVTLTDDTGSVVARWLGREAIGGIGLGRELSVEGVPVSESGTLVFLNPVYRLLPSRR